MTPLMERMLESSSKELSKQNLTSFFGKITRRQFLTWGAGISTPTFLGACATAGKPSPDIGKPEVECPPNGSFVRINFGGYSWYMEAQWFGTKGKKCRIKCETDSQNILIKVTGGRLPGLPIDMGLIIRLYPSSKGWLFDLTLDRSRLATGHSLIGWLDDSKPIVENFGFIRKGALEKKLRKVGLELSLNGPMQLTLHHNGHFELVSKKLNPEAIQLNAAGGIIRTAKLTGQLVLPNEDFELSWVRSAASKQDREVSCNSDTENTQQDNYTVLEFEFWQPTMGREPASFPCGSTGDSLELIDTESLHAVVHAYEAAEAIIAVSVQGKSQARFVRKQKSHWFSGINLGAWTWFEHIGTTNREALFNAKLGDNVLPVTVHGNVIWPKTEANKTPGALRANDGDANVEVESDALLTPFMVSYCNKLATHYDFELPISNLNLAIPDADYACLELKDYVLKIDMDGATSSSTHGKVSGSDGGTICLPMNNTNLCMKRASDFVNLRFTFANVFMRINETTSEIVKLENANPPFRDDKRDSWAVADGLPAFAVHFPPQYLAEQAFFRQTDPKPARTSKSSAGDLTFRIPVDGNRKYSYEGSDVNPDYSDFLDGRDPARKSLVRNRLKSEREDELLKILGDKTKLAVHSRLSHESRIAFSLDLSDIEKEDGSSKKKVVLPIELKLSSLTNFSGLKTLVSPRALSRGADMKTQLSIPEIKATTPRSAVTNLISDSIEPPTEFETSLEIVYRLMLSPDSKAEWNVVSGSAHPVSRMRPPMLTILDQEAGQSSLRAIWSPDFETRFLTDHVENREHPTHSDRAPWIPENGKGCEGERPLEKNKFRMSLDRRDRHELVALTSVYGLPALRSIPPHPPTNGQKKVNENRAPSSVVPSDSNGATKFLHMHAEEGYYSPVPLNKSKVVLNSYGAFSALEGRWEPPAARSINKKVLWPALTVERWRHLTAMGRDVDVEVVYKGFMVPCGHRASVVKVTQRRFDVHPKFGYPVAVLVQRMFCTISDPVKTFPALNQPHLGRGWPVKKVVVVTTQTPDIVDPYDSANGSVKGKLELRGNAFWPRLKAGDGNEVIFQCRLDEDDELAELPMLFVDNTAAHFPDDIEKIKDYYNDDIKTPDIRATAAFKGQRRAYAESLKPGDTEFETFTWDLNIVGRKPYSLTDGSIYAMDAFMEGEDQPPFYPFLNQANIRAQSLSALSGNSTGRINVEFDKDYLEVGFGDTTSNSQQVDDANRNPDSAENPSQIYLLVSDNVPTLNFSSKGQSSGGIAKPNLNANALSRSQGVVGGASAPSGRNLISALSAGQSPSSQAIEKAKSGTFDPSEFFSDAKLLGLISLKDICKVAAFTDVAPKLIEELAYSLPIDKLKQAVRIIKRLETGISLVEEQLNKIPVGNGISWKRLYPDLSQRITDLKLPLKKATTILSAIDSGAPTESELTKAHKLFINNLSDLVNVIKALEAEIGHIRRNPTPTIVKKSLTDIKEGLSQIHSVLDVIGPELSKQISDALKTAVADKLTVELCEYYKDDDNKNKRDTIDYATTYLYGKSFGETPIDRKTGKPEIDPKTRKPMVLCRNPLFDELGKPNLNALRDSLLYDTVGQPMLSAIESVRRLENIKQDGLKTASKTLIELLRGVSELDEMRKAAEDLHQILCDQCHDLLAPISTTLTSGFDKFKKIVTSIQKASSTILSIDTDAILKDVEYKYTDTSSGKTIEISISAAEAREAIVGLKARLRNQHRRLAEIILELEELRVQISAKKICDGFQERTSLDLAHALTRTQNLRRDAIEQAQAMLEALIESNKFFQYSSAPSVALNRLNINQNSQFGITVIPKSDIESAQKDIAEFGAELAVRLTSVAALVDNGDANFNSYRDKIKSLANDPLIGKFQRLQKRLDRIAKNYWNEADALKQSFSGTNMSPEARLAVVREAARYAAAYDRRVLALLNQGEVLFSEWNDNAKKMAVSILIPVVKMIVVIHESFLDALGKLSDAITDSSNSIDKETKDLLMLVLSKDAYGFIETMTNQAKYQKEILGDLNKFKSIQNANGPEEILEKANSVYQYFWNEDQNSWKNELKILEIPEKAKLILDTFGKGDLGKFIDFSNLERALKDAALAFLPTRLNLSYDWGTEIRPFPASKPIFQMLPPTQRRSSSKNITDQDLSIVVRGGIDLLTQKKEFSVVSEIKPFSLHLFPSLDLVTIKFKGATFIADDKGSDFDVAIDDVIIGDQLSYIQELAKALSPDTGPYVRLLFSPPAIEAGFRLNLGTINLGPIAFINIALEVSCELPLDNREALFRFALSSRSRPFLISAFPYGGGGFLALKTQATDIVFVGASFEFGGVGDLTFGPLKAHARATTGVYVEKSKARGTVVEGFFVAAGEAQIACFSICTCLGVSVRQASGSMIGEAHFSFEFKVGFVKLKYGVNVVRQLSGGSGADNNFIGLIIEPNKRIETGEVTLSAFEKELLIAQETLPGLKPVVKNLKPNETPEEKLIRICKHNSIKLNDCVIVSSVEDRRDWRGYEFANS